MARRAGGQGLAVLRGSGTGHRVCSPEFERISRESTFPLGVGQPGRVWAQEEPCWIADVQQDHSYPRLQAAAGEGLRAAFAFPIKADREVMGVFEFFSRAVRRPDADLLQMFAAIGAEVGQLLARMHAEQRIHESEARKAAMLEAALDCIITIDRDGRIIEFNPAAERTFGYRRTDVLGREVADLLVPEALRAEGRRGFAQFLETGQAVVIGRRFETSAMRADGTEFPAELSIVPIASGGQTLLTAYLRDITEQKRMAKQLAFRATHDPLTQVLNRASFMQRLRDASKRASDPEGHMIAVFFVDMDRFKAINDSLGHIGGDRLLVAIARRLQACVRPGDAVGRLGGDEFAILLEKLPACRTPRSWRTESRTHSTGRSLSTAARWSRRRASALPLSSGGDRPEDLLGAADTAMYDAKAMGRARYKVVERHAAK